jgi:hypothetical protein
VSELDLTPGETELVDEAGRDVIDMAWTLIHLGIRRNDGTDPPRPTTSDIDRAFESLERLSRAGLLRIGHTEYVDGGLPGRVAPVDFVEDPLTEVRQRVLTAIRDGDDGDWQFALWLTAP